MVASSGVLGLVKAPKAAASGGPTFTSAQPITNYTGQTSDITDLQVTGTGNPTVPVTLRVSNGTLHMTTTTGLTFTGASSGSTLAFSGAMSDVNTALATLQYTRTSGGVSGSDTLEATMVASDQVYDPDNGHLYQFVNTSVTWDSASTAASADSYNGIPGYLATVTSAGENAYLTARLPNGGWIGASDAAQEGQWKWVDGPENGTLFYTGNGSNGTGQQVSGQYSNWNTGEPNNSGGNENCAQFLSGSTGLWNDLMCNGQTLPYVVEYGSPGNLPTVANEDIAITTLPETDNISSCAQLEALSSDTHAYDTINLTSDIDCTGQTVSALFPDGYYGTFNGQNHTVKGFVLNDPSGNNDGLFSEATGATFENVTLTDGSVAGNYEVGALLGVGTDVTITNVSSDWTVNVGVYYCGGLVGGMSYDTNGGPSYTLSNISVTGNLTCPDGYAGDLVGYIGINDVSLTMQHISTTGNVTAGDPSGYGYSGGITGSVTLDTYGGVSNMTMQDVYTRGNVAASSNQAYEGGLIGDLSEDGSGNYVSTATLNRVYASGHISGSANVGGLIGDIYPFNGQTADFGLTVSHSFAAGEITGGEAASTGALVGTNQGVVTSTDNYFDQPRTGQAACAGSAANSISNCTAVNAANSDLRYFFDNHTNHPLDAWNFSSTWVANGNDFPTFAAEGDGDGVSDAVETAAPNGGDANNDGIADDQQANVASFVDPVTGKYITLEAPGSCGITNIGAAGAQGADSDYTYPSGLLNYTLACGSAGYTAQVKVYVYGASSSGMVLRKYNPNTHTYTTVSGAALQQTTIGGQQVVVASYQVTDGGALDEDGTVNGTIVDPVGLAQPVAGGTLTDTGVNLIAITPIAVTLTAAAACAVRRERSIAAQSSQSN